METLADLIKAAGGPGVVAEQLSTAEKPLTQPAVSNWIARKRVPAGHVVALAKLCGKQPHEIRPDVFPAPADDQAA